MPDRYRGTPMSLEEECPTTEEYFSVLRPTTPRSQFQMYSTQLETDDILRALFRDERPFPWSNEEFELAPHVQAVRQVPVRRAKALAALTVQITTAVTWRASGLVVIVPRYVKRAPSGSI